MDIVELRNIKAFKDKETRICFPNYCFIDKKRLIEQRVSPFEVASIAVLVYNDFIFLQREVTMSKGNLLLAQSGGATAVINASAVGVIKRARDSKAFDKVLCAHFGMNGILKEDFYDVSDITDSQLELLARTPASAFGSCRYKLPVISDNTEIFEEIERVLKKYNVTCLAYNGGNDSMDTCSKINDYFTQTGFACRVVGVPKTIDNDLLYTHYCPGYGSASK